MLCDRRSLFSWPWRWKLSTRASTAVSWTRPFSPWSRASSLRRKPKIMLPDKRCCQQYYILIIAKRKAGTQIDIQNIPLPDRLVCRDRRDRQSCKIFVSCVNFSWKQRSLLYILKVYTHLNVNLLHNCWKIYTFCSILTKRGPNYW